MTGPAPDPITLTLVQNRLDHLCRHMGWVMTRTARSPIFSQSHDFSCFVTDATGTLVSNADGIPIHTGGGGFAVRALLAAFGDDFAPGDAFVLNDPYVAGGNHLPDWVIARPVFVDGDLFAFTCNRAHQSDIGGGAAGTYNSAAREIWQEGLRIPPVRLVEAGRLRSDVFELLKLNSRTPDLMDGDLRAMLGSTRIGADGVVALATELGVAQARVCLAGILDHAERRFRAAVAELPDGRYEAVETMDNDCFETVDVSIRCAVTVDGDRMTVDFTGTDPQIAGFKNSSVANTFSAVAMALLSFFEPDLPRNEAALRGVELIAPEGTIVNALPPAPMTMNTVFVAHEIIHAVWRCLSQADPGRALAGWGKNIFGVTAGERTDGSRFVLYHWCAAAAGGATTGRDGFEQIGHLVALGGLTLPNVEYNEQQFPVRFHRYELRTDASGPGRHRGGTGVEYEVDVLAPASWSFRGEGLGAPSGYGLAGGGDGAGGRMVLTDLASGEQWPAPKYGVHHRGPSRVTASSPGGGGWGDPGDRPRDDVVRDVRDGVLSREAAERQYGVVVA
jgi:N-methylhydantoinase B